MSKVIVYTNGNGNISVCSPSGEIPIEEVLIKDCPIGSIIIDESDLPTDTDFFNAWRLSGSKITIDFDTAVSYQNQLLNALSRGEAEHRIINVNAGILNKLSDSDWLLLLSTARSNISSATTLQQLRDAVVPIEQAIIANK
jgi:hypothetical protein